MKEKLTSRHKQPGRPGPDTSCQCPCGSCTCRWQLVSRYEWSGPACNTTCSQPSAGVSLHSHRLYTLTGRSAESQGTARSTVVVQSNLLCWNNCPVTRHQARAEQGKTKKVEAGSNRWRQEASNGTGGTQQPGKWELILLRQNIFPAVHCNAASGIVLIPQM